MVHVETTKIGGFQKYFVRCDHTLQLTSTYLSLTPNAPAPFRGNIYSCIAAFLDAYQEYAAGQDRNLPANAKRLGLARDYVWLNLTGGQGEIPAGWTPPAAPSREVLAVFGGSMDMRAYMAWMPGSDYTVPEKLSVDAKFYNRHDKSSGQSSGRSTAAATRALRATLDTCYVFGNDATITVQDPSYERKSFPDAINDYVGPAFRGTRIGAYTVFENGFGDINVQADAWLAERGIVSAKTRGKVFIIHNTLTPPPVKKSASAPKSVNLKKLRKPRNPEAPKRKLKTPEEKAATKAAAQARRREKRQAQTTGEQKSRRKTKVAAARTDGMVIDVAA